MTLRKQKVILINRRGVNPHFIVATLCLQGQAYIYGKGDCGFTHKVRHEPSKSVLRQYKHMCKGINREQINCMAHVGYTCTCLLIQTEIITLGCGIPKSKTSSGYSISVPHQKLEQNSSSPLAISSGRSSLRKPLYERL